MPDKYKETRDRPGHGMCNGALGYLHPFYVTNIFLPAVSNRSRFYVRVHAVGWSI